MVLPFNAMSGFTMGPPPEEVIRLRPILKVSVIILGLATVIELAAAYVPSALTDLITVMFGAMLLRRDFPGLMQGLPAFTVIAAFNFFFQVLTLIQFLTIYPGFEHFLSDKCPTSIKRHDASGHEITELKNLCSWRTIIGNVALLLAVLLEFVCLRLSWKMFQSVRDTTSSMLASANMPMMDLEGGGQGLTPSLAAAAAAQRGPAMAQARPTGLAGPGPAAGPPGFTPFAGAPHRLGDD